MSIITEGYMLMIIGMSVVFAFLSLLIVMIMLSSKFVTWFNKVYPEPVEETNKIKKAVNSGNDEIALVVAAVKAFNN